MQFYTSMLKTINVFLDEKHIWKEQHLSDRIANIFEPGVFLKLVFVCNATVVKQRMTRFTVCWVLNTLITLCFVTSDTVNIVEFSKFLGKMFSFDSLSPLTSYCLKPNTPAFCLLKCLEISPNCMGVVKYLTTGCCEAFFSPAVIDNLGYFKFINVNSSVSSLHWGLCISIGVFT